CTRDVSESVATRVIRMGDLTCEKSELLTRLNPVFHKPFPFRKRDFVTELVVKKLLPRGRELGFFLAQAEQLPRFLHVRLLLRRTLLRAVVMGTHVLGGCAARAVAANALDVFLLGCDGLFHPFRLLRILELLPEAALRDFGEF